MEAFDIGHKETRCDLPDPLAASGFDRLGTSALPGTALSAASAIVFLVVLGILLADPERRALFVLPWPAFAVALPTALLAAAIAFGCRNHPGRHWPRYWLLIFCNWSILVAAASFLELQLVEKPLLHALTTAGAAAVLTLLPRLVMVQPDSKLVQRIALLTLAGVLGVILPSSCYVAHTVIDHHQQQVDRRIHELQRWTQEIGQVTSIDWSQWSDPQASEDAVKRLEKLSFAGALTDPELWDAAVVLGKDEELTGAAWKLVAEVVAGLDPQRTPRLSQLAEPAGFWDPVARRWLPNALFPAWSATTGDYHRHLGRLFLELRVDDPSPDSAPLSAMVAYSQRKRAELCDHLATLAQTWADHWAVYQIPEHQSCVGSQRSLVDLLQASIVVDGDELPAAALWQLMNLSLADARELSRRAPGCRLRENDESLRLDCYAYRAREDGPGAGLRVEMRLVFKSQRGLSLTSSSRPTEIIYFLPVPENQEIGAFRSEVMTGLHTAVRKVWNGDVHPIEH
ncbi:MAG: hypothetical protein V3T72_19780, partial [Thermoanaerobaculia bacterium]